MLKNPRFQFFILISTIYIAVFQILILIYPKGSENIYCHRERTDILSMIFVEVTRLGEWIPLTVLGLGLLISNRKKLYSVAVGYLIFNILVNQLKRILDAPRPLSFFQNGEITQIPNLQPLFHHSMPSGHTFAAFFVMTVVCLFFHFHRNWMVLFYIIAIMVGISRIYLMCHFKEDVFVGSTMGIFGGVVSYIIYTKWNESHAV